MPSSRTPLDDCDRTGEIGSWKEPFVVPCSLAMKLVVCAFQILALNYHLKSIQMYDPCTVTSRGPMVFQYNDRLLRSYEQSVYCVYPTPSSRLLVV
jgi:hypothetical protein